MVKKSLLDWYQSENIEDSEKQTLNKMGIDDNNQYQLNDLKHILFCKQKAVNTEKIKDKITRKIKKIIFFNPTFINDSKPDASNYSCALVTDANNDSFIDGDDLVVKKFPNYGKKNKTKKLESKIQNGNPILAVVMSDSKVSFKGNQ